MTSIDLLDPWEQQQYIKDTSPYSFKDTWNPLENSSDAFELMVGFNIHVWTDSKKRTLTVYSEQGHCTYSLPSPERLYPAIRKIVVKLAAEILYKQRNPPKPWYSSLLSVFLS